MDLRQLRYFLVVAQERSITAAAARLHLTQPPLSAQLARLEHDLGVTLLVRHRRGVDLTAAGRDLVEHARHLLADVDTAAESVRRIGQGRSGRLALMFEATTAWSVLPPLVRRFHAARPDVELYFREDRTDAVAEHVRAGRADLGVVHLPPAGTTSTVGSGLDVKVVRREPLVAVLPRDRADAFGDPVDLTALSGETYFGTVRSEWGGIAAHLLGACRLSGFEPALQEVELVQTAVALVGAGLGVSVLPAAVERICGPDAVTRPLAQHFPLVETGLLRRRTETPDPLVQLFLRLASEVQEET
ncbi:LysR family transcriptional regulator [Pseudonocardia xinjiangensis]|uniref:LysR family transcriptional regulator n=1 Tax=Pseudonocardia xinjiangensis TaxID=75289 RepID=UPI003D9170C3